MHEFTLGLDFPNITKTAGRYLNFSGEMSHFAQFNAPADAPWPADP